VCDLLEPVRGLPMVRRQGQTLTVTHHRPWPIPDFPWVMGQTWEDLLFAHWPIAVESLRRVVPEQLPIDQFGGTAWIGITPFVVRALRPRLLPPLPVGSRFPELNVRTYVTVDGKPGIWFFSLDAASRVAVTAARRAYGLPYFHAHMARDRTARSIRFRSDRAPRDHPPARLEAEYAPDGDVFTARPGGLEHFLTERYCLYTLDGRQRVRRADIHHPPWPLQPAQASFATNTMSAPVGITLTDQPLLHFAHRQDVVVWAPVAAG
jgi:uncharacterized protein YqjF (DUF2071 family)